VLHLWLDLMVLGVFSNRNDSVILAIVIILLCFNLKYLLFVVCVANICSSEVAAEP